MGQIYGIKDLSKNKIIYIGQTIRNYKVRWQQHKQQSKERNYALYDAFHKYGINNFMPFLIEECDNSLLDVQEQYWINFYHTYIEEDGYNLTKGGKKDTSKSIKKPVYQYDLNGKFIQSYESINEAQWKVSNHQGSEIQKAVNGKIKSAYGYLWSFEKKECLTPPSLSYKKIVYQYDKNMNFIQQYDSINLAAKALNKQPANISACALGKRKTAYGFIWTYNKAGY